MFLRNDGKLFHSLSVTSASEPYWATHSFRCLMASLLLRWRVIWSGVLPKTNDAALLTCNMSLKKREAFNFATASFAWDTKQLFQVNLLYAQTHHNAKEKSDRINALRRRYADANCCRYTKPHGDLMWFQDNTQSVQLIWKPRNVLVISNPSGA